MGLNDNIEKQIREKLNAREIQPSAQAWDRLDAMLSVTEEKKTRRLALPLRSIGIAAAVLVFVTLGTFWYNNTESPKAEATGVAVKDNAENEKPAETHSSEDAATPIIKPEPLSQQNIRVAETTTTSAALKEPAGNQNNQRVQPKEKDSQKPAISHQPPTANGQNQEAIAQSTPKKEQPDAAWPKTAASNPDAVAQNESSASKVKVNANSLLSEVDGELELTFREKVFKKVNKNYKEVKVALANRNLDQ